jgi:hypothetical protein
MIHLSPRIIRFVSSKVNVRPSTGLHQAQNYPSKKRLLLANSEAGAELEQRKRGACLKVPARPLFLCSAGH